MRIRYFLTLAANRNFTKTAEYYYVSQSTISKHIALLEEEVGTKLFSRNTQQVWLTPAGEILQGEFEGIIGQIDAALERVRKTGEAAMGRLRIGVPALININRLLPDFVKNFSAGHPDILLEVDTFNFKELRTHLLSGELDMIITPSFEMRGETCVQRMVLSRSKSRVFYSKTLFENEAPSLEEVVRHPMLTLQEEESHESAYFMQHLWNFYHITPPRVIHVNSMETMQIYLESGMGVAILGSSFRIALSDSLTYVELDEEEFKVGTDAIWRMDSHNTSLPVLIRDLRGGQR